MVRRVFCAVACVQPVKRLTTLFALLLCTVLPAQTVRSLGVSDDVARGIVQNVRVTGEGGAFERRADGLVRRAPELRHHRGPEIGADGDEKGKR